MPRLALLPLVALACARQPVEVTCVYPDEDQTQDTATQDTSDTGESVQAGPVLVSWDWVANLPCDAVYARDAMLLDAETMALVVEFSVLLQEPGGVSVAGAGTYEIRDGALYWATRCDDDNSVLTLFAVAG